MPITTLIPDLDKHEQQLGVRFRDLMLLQRALTHRSYVNERPQQNIEDNERLEFLGDAIIDFWVAGYLYEHFPGLREGSLTRLRAGVVRNDTLALMAQRVGIGQWLLLGKGEEENGGRDRASNLGSAFEALAGALYIDQGMEAVQKFLSPHIAPLLDAIVQNQSDKDAKSRLQEWSQATLGEAPEYRTVAMTGPDHDREFTIEVSVAGERYGTGKGRNKQVAAQAAARDALSKISHEGRLG